VEAEAPASIQSSVRPQPVYPTGRSRPSMAFCHKPGWSHSRPASRARTSRALSFWAQAT